MNEGARRISKAAPFVGPPRSSARSRSLSAIQASLPPLPPPVRCGEVDCEVLEAEEPCTSSTSVAEVPNDAEEDLVQDEELECAELSLKQKMIYVSSFMLHFGVSDAMSKFMDDLCLIVTGDKPQPEIRGILRTMKSEVLTDYEYSKVAYCNSCDASLPNGTRGRCRNDSCRIEGLNPKRSKNMRPTTIHTVKIAPQLDLIMNKHLDTLLKFHGDLHLDLLGTFRKETSHFPQYRGDIESWVEFDNRKINVVLTINFDGVKLKKLTRCEAWPIYLTSQAFVCDKLNDVRVDVNSVKTLHTAVSDIPTSSDSVVRSLTGTVKKLCDVVVGMSGMVDGLFVQQQQLRSSLRTANNHMSKLAAIKLPERTTLTAKNLTNTWIIPSQPPFKECNLKELMTKWRRSGRSSADEHLVHCTDFMRAYLVQACEPPDAVQRYSCRLSGKGGKSEKLVDLPEKIVEILTECMLDGLGLGQPELQLSSKELKEHPTEFWLKLGSNDTERTTNLEYRQHCRIRWVSNCRLAITRACNDIRQYIFETNKLKPKPKQKPKKRHVFVEEGSADEPQNDIE